MDAAPLMLFAQQKPPAGAEAAGGVFAILMVCMMLVLYVILPLVMIGLQIWFYITAFQALSAVSERNRDMEPGMIFLMLIPCFGIVWYFFVVIRIASSLQKEYADRGLPAEGDFGMLLGILSPLIPCVGLITFIMWIMKIRNHTKELQGRGRSAADD